jgi:hypothetical protein
MAYESRLVAGVLLIVLPTVMIGGVSILPSSLAIRPTCRTRCVRICARRTCTCRSLADTGPRGTSLRGRGQPLQYHQVVRPWLVPLAAILVPAAFFLAVLAPDATTRNAFIYLAYVGAVLLGAGVLVLGIGVIRTSPS